MPKKLLVTVDSLRYDHFDFMPRTRAFLDQDHDRAFAVSTATPGSFPGIMAGQYPTPGGIDDNPEFPGSLDCYRVGISTNHLLSERYGYGKPYDHFEAPSSDDSGIKDRVARAIPEGTIARNVVSAGWNVYQRISNRFSEVDRTFRRAEEVIETLLEAIEDRSDWFGWIHLMEPHHPYEPDHGDVDRVIAQNATRRVLDGRGSKNDEELVKMAYKQEIRELDDTLDRLWGALPPETEVIFTADHGELLGENYEKSWGHPGLMLPELLHVPFGSRNIDLPTGSVLSHIDIGTLFLDEEFSGGETTREYALATYGDEKAVISADAIYDGERFLGIAGDRPDDEPENAETMLRRWRRFDPEPIRRTDDALKGDLQDLGYM